MYGLLRSEDAWSPALIWSQNKLYGSNTVDHVMSGKAFARAVRGHVIVQEQDAIVQLLLQRALNGECHAEVINSLQVLYGRVWTDKVVVDDCTLLESEDMNLITSKLPSVVCMLSAQPRTSKLWITVRSLCRHHEVIHSYMQKEHPIGTFISTLQNQCLICLRPQGTFIMPRLVAFMCNKCVLCPASSRFA